MPACNQPGEHKAPKNKDLKEYYYFCKEHVQEYNKSWNFFEGMSLEDMEEHIAKATVWDRPTRRYDSMANADAIRKKAWQTYHFTDREPPKEDEATRRRRYHASAQTPEFDAMVTMNLEPPITLEGIKARYKELVKKYHPDTNRDDPNAEELLKKINMAYTILKNAYQKFDTMAKEAN